MPFQEVLDDNSTIVKEKVGEIHKFINSEVDDNANLSFDSSSKVSEWSLWTQVVSFISYLQQELWEESKSELKEIQTNGIVANKSYFSREWRNFQYGDSLKIDDSTGQSYYETVDESKQIIKRLSIDQNDNGWSLKVATEDDDGKPIALSDDQIIAYQTYILQTQPPGFIIPVYSLPSDKLKLSFDIYYDPSVNVDELKPLVETAITTYLSSIDIDGDVIYYLSKHIAAIQEVEYISDVVINDPQAKAEGAEYTSFERVYIPSSGYLELDPDIESDFDSYINYKSSL